MDDPQQTIELYENRCAVCYKPFFQKKRGRLRRTCSPACRSQLYLMRKKQRAEQAQEIESGSERKRGHRERWPTTCPECGGPIEQPARGRKRKTCSDICRQRKWRRENPICVVCGKRFKRKKGRWDHRFCSEPCLWQAKNWRREEAQRQERIAALRGHRPEWLPEPGSGYREETVPWDGNEDEAVIREREPEPNYEPEPWAGMDPARAAIVQEMHAAVQEEAAKAAEEEARRARRLAWDLLEDESKWF